MSRLARSALLGVANLVMRYLIVFLLFACAWRFLYIVRPCLGEMPGWPNPPTCSAATLFHRATVPGPQSDMHYLFVAIVALLIVLMGHLFRFARSARRKLPRGIAFAVLLASVAAPGIALAWLAAAVQPCLMDLLESPSFLLMCFALRDKLADTPANPVAYELTALFLATALAAFFWRWDELNKEAATR
jgi:hypothetical protein